MPLADGPARPKPAALAALIVLAWSVIGLLFGFSQSWLIVISTATTIVTFLMVFIIQHQQHRDSRAIQLKLDELVKASEGARNVLMSAQHSADEELERLEEESRRLRRLEERQPGDQDSRAGRRKA